MSIEKKCEEAPPPSSNEVEGVTITVRAVKEEGAGVYEVTVKTDQKEGSALVRTSPRHLAFQPA